MKIASIKKIDIEQSRMRGIASVILDDNNILEDIRIIEEDNGLFIAF